MNKKMNQACWHRASLSPSGLLATFHVPICTASSVHTSSLPSYESLVYSWRGRLQISGATKVMERAIEALEVGSEHLGFPKGLKIICMKRK